MRSLIIAAAVTAAGCAQACDNCVPSSTYTVCYAQGGCIASYTSDGTSIPDIASAPNELPDYEVRVLLWTGERWVIASRDKVDKKGNWWSAINKEYLSKKHPMWKYLPVEPPGTPKCKIIIDGKEVEKLPSDGSCPVE